MLPQAISEYNSTSIELTDGEQKDVLFMARYPQSEWVLAPKLIAANEATINEKFSEEVIDEIKNGSIFKIYNLDISQRSPECDLELNKPDNRLFEIDRSQYTQHSIKRVKADNHSTVDGIEISHNADCKPDAGTARVISKHCRIHKQFSKISVTCSRRLTPSLTV